MDIDSIIDAVRNSRVRITDHADEEAVDDGLSYEEIYFSVVHGDIIEGYLGDSALAQDKTEKKRS